MSAAQGLSRHGGTVGYGGKWASKTDECASNLKKILKFAGGSRGGRGSRPVSRVLSWMAIHLGRTSPRASSDLPGGPADHRPRHLPLAPYLVLLRVGFALPPLLPAARCALTAPFHPCRRPEPRGRYVFCGTFRGLAPPRRYLAPCPAEPGLSSTAVDRRQRPSGRLPVCKIRPPRPTGKPRQTLKTASRLPYLEERKPDP